MVSKKNKAKLYELIENYRKATIEHELICERYENKYAALNGTVQIKELEKARQKACAELDFFIKNI